jgi:hypothetical protein
VNSTPWLEAGMRKLQKQKQNKPHYDPSLWGYLLILFCKITQLFISAMGEAWLPSELLLPYL